MEPRPGDISTCFSDPSKANFNWSLQEKSEKCVKAFGDGNPTTQKDMK